MYKDSHPIGSHLLPLEVEYFIFYMNLGGLDRISHRNCNPCELRPLSTTDVHVQNYALAQPTGKMQQGIR